MNTGFSLVGVLLMIAMMAAIIGAVVWVVWLVIRRGAGLAAGSRSPLELLDARYARGEIAIEEYQERRRVLEAEGHLDSPGSQREAGGGR